MDRVVAAVPLAAHPKTRSAKRRVQKESARASPPAIWGRLALGGREPPFAFRSTVSKSSVGRIYCGRLKFFATLLIGDQSFNGGWNPPV